MRTVLKFLKEKDSIKTLLSYFQHKMACLYKESNSQRFHIIRFIQQIDSLCEINRLD